MIMSYLVHDMTKPWILINSSMYMNLIQTGDGKQQVLN